MATSKTADAHSYDDVIYHTGDCPDECPHFHRYCNLINVQDPEFTMAIPWAFPVQRVRRVDKNILQCQSSVVVHMPTHI